MKKQKLFALALAGATTIGTLAAGMPVMASEIPNISAGDGHSGNTTVNLTIEKAQGTYTLYVPVTTALEADGTAVSLTDGIEVTGENMENSVTVTAESGNLWQLKSENTNTRIDYKLYADKNAEEAKTSWEFSAEAINAGSAYQEVYAKVDENSVKAADPGDYSDVITFTAEATGSGSGGGEITPDEPEQEEKSYVRITSENIESLLPEIDKEYCSEQDAREEAKKIFNESDNVSSISYIYKFESGKIWMCYADENETSVEWTLYVTLKSSCDNRQVYIKRQ